MAGMISHVILMSFVGEKIAEQFVAGRHDTVQAPAHGRMEQMSLSCAPPDGSLSLIMPGGSSCLSKEASWGSRAKSVPFQLGDLSECIAFPNTHFSHL